MGTQILNRREPIYTEEIPAEIKDTTGFIKATNYATDTTGGTVKVDDDYGVELTAAGKLRGTVETAVNYAEASTNLLVSKGTLDNVLAAQPGGGVTVEQLAAKTASDNTAKTLTPSNAISGYAAIDLVVYANEGLGIHNFIPVAALTQDDSNFQTTSALYYRASNTFGAFVFYYKTDGTIVTGTTGNAFACQLYGIK